MSEQAALAPPGFRSEEGRQILRRRALVLAVGLGLIQILVPMAIMFAMLVSMFEAGDAPTVDVAQGAFWERSLWLVERGHGRSRGSSRLLKWDPDAGRPPEHARLPAVTDPALVVAGGALWVVGEDRSVAMRREGIDVRPVSPPFARRISTPFELRGAPGLVGEADGEPALFRLDPDTWEWEAEPIDVGAGGAVEELRSVVMVIPDGAAFRLFTVDEEGVRARSGLAGFTDAPLAEWERLPSAEGWPSAWTAARAGGAIAAFTVRRDVFDLRVDATRLGPDGRWSPLDSWSLGEVLDLQAYDAGDGRRAFLVVAGGGGSVTAHEMAAGRVLRSTELVPSALGPFTRLNALSGWFTVASTALTPILLLLALGGAMRRHRTGTFERDGARLPLASLPRRWIAGAIDLALAAGPLAAVYAAVVATMGRVGEEGPGATLRAMTWLGVAALWALVALFALSFVEGRTGSTPGNRICGIRTVGPDLGRPGLGRALLRNFLVVIDAAFGFAVGIALIAVTARQQRLGDLAAKTVVLGEPPAPERNLSFDAGRGSD